jgi:hypothetical protein
MTVEGYSNFLWVILLTPFISLGVEPLIAARVLSMLAAVVSLLFLDRLIAGLFPDLETIGKTLSLMVIGTMAPFAAWTLGGLETVFLCMLIVLFVLIETQCVRRRFYLSPLILLAIALTRPEGIMLFFVMLLYRIWQQDTGVKQNLISGAIFLFPYGLFLIWRSARYGYLLPNTAYLKLASNLNTAKLAFEWVIQFFVLNPLLTLILVISLTILVRERYLLKGSWLLINLIMGSFIMFVLYAGRDWMPHHRFLAPVVPLLGLYVAKVLDRVQMGKLKVASYTLTALTSIFSLYMAMTIYRSTTVEFGVYTNGLVRGGEWIKQNTDPDDIIAVSDGGVLAYYSGRETIDIVGLNNEYIAHSELKSDPDYVLQLQPQIIQLHLEFLPTGDYHGTNDYPQTTEILNHPAFDNCYELFQDHLEDPFYPYFFRRICD